MVVSNLFDASDVPHDAQAWVEELTDELWSECCRHGEVERILLLPNGSQGGNGEGEGEGLPPCAAVRFQSLIAAASAVDALNGRFFASRELSAAFDDGTAAPLIPGEEDRDRQHRFGFGEIAVAYQESTRLLRLAAAEGVLFIACASFVCELELYEVPTSHLHAHQHRQ